MTPIIRSAILAFIVIGLAGVLNAQTLTDIGTAAPSPGASDIYQLSTSGNQTAPDGLNYYTDNNPPAGQTFTTGTNPSGYLLTSVALRTGGIGNNSGIGTAQPYYLYVYSVSGSTATLLQTYTSGNITFNDGDWLQWSGLSVPLSANTTYAYSFGKASTTSGWEPMAVANNNVYAGGQIGLIPTSGGTITFGSSHNFDAVFDLGLVLPTTPSVSAATISPAANVRAGTRITFAASAAGALPLYYQWQFNSGSGFVNLSGANTNTLSFVAAVTNTGSYQLVLTNSYGAVTSAPVALAVAPAFTNIPASMPWPNPCYGMNVGNELELNWGPPNASLFYSAAFAGFNAVRIPCAWEYSGATTNISGGVTNYVISANYMAQVKQTVDAAIDAGMYVMINDHWDDGWLQGNITNYVDPIVNAKVKAYWTQIATTFAGYDNHLLFAACNEPSVADPTQMLSLMAYYQTFVNTVRGVGGNNASRWLVLQGGGDTSWLTTLPTDTVSNRLMVEYHNYTPFTFTQLQGDASWGNMQYFWGPAYHYSGDASRDCGAPEEGAIDSGFQQLVDQYVSKGIPVMIGEFQAAGKQSLSGTEATWNSLSCYYWNKYLVDSAHAHGLSPFYWSTGGSPFDYGTGAVDDTNEVRVLTGGVAFPPPNGAPYAASGLNATLNNNTSVNLSWTAGSGATSYNIYRAAESGYESSIAPVATGITGTSYTDTGLNSGTTYYYQVVAVNGSGSTGFSPEAYATTPGVNPDPAQFNFETDSQRWTAGGSPISGVATSTAQHYAGNQSLAVTFNGTAAGSSSVAVGNVVVVPGGTITFHVWIPSGSQISTVQPYLQDYNWAWTSVVYGSLTANAWNTITLTVPSTAISPVQQLGIQFATSNAWTGTCYIDSIAWTTSPGTPPGAPANLAASAGNAQVGLTWSASSGATSYNVKRSTTSGSGYSTVTSVTGTSYTDTGLNNGTTYYYVVSAANAAGESANSSQASATPQASAPAAPTGLTATAGNAQATLNWTASSGATSYNVKRSTTSGGSYTTVASGVTGTSYTDSGLSNGTTYYYVVSAVNSGGESANSAQASATPQASAPATPTGLAATPGNAQVALTWSASSGATSYNVKRSTTSGSGYSTVTSVTGTSYTDTGLANGTAYYYVVSAVNSGGESANSSQVTATPTGGGALPSPWVTADIGAVGATGNASYSSSTFTVNGSGADIWGTADEFRFVYQQITGDCDFRARVATLQNTHVAAKAGVMIRETLNDNSIQALVNVTPSVGAEFIWRTSTGGSSSSTGASGIAAPYWVRIVRSGSTFTAYSSADGATWTTIGSQSITMASTVYVGLAVCSHADGTLCAATFDNVSVSGPTLPPVPTGLAATAGNAQVALTWSASSGATSYNVKRSTTSGGSYTTVASGVTGTSYTDTGLSNGTTYYYVVSAVNGGGESANSSQVSATPQVSAPSAPTGLTATAGNGQVALSWSASSGATSYNVKRSTTSGSGYSTVTSVTGTSYTDTGLANGTTYYYVVSAVNSGGESANSAQASATPQASAPAAPTGLAATAGNAQVALTWSASSGATSYNVKRSTTSGGSYTTVASGVTGTSYTDTGLSNGTTYYYVVSAVNGGGESANSSQVSATPQVSAPSAPTGLTATAGNAQVALSWTASSGATSYNVKRSTTSGGSYTTVASGVTGTSYTDTGVSNGTTYYYVVSAVNGGGESANSSQVSATPQASQLPAPWQTQDIGSVGLTGNAALSNNVFTVSGAGADIQGSADAFRFVYVTTTGDCTVIARVASVQNIDSWSKAGIMIRQGLNAGDANAFIAVTPGNGVTWQYRSSSGGGTTWNQTTGLSAPYWVKLVRSGSTFTGYYSADGTTWTQQGTTSITMTNTVMVGLALTSHNSSSLGTATYDNVTVPGWPTSTAPSAPTGLTATAGNGQVALSWTASSGATSYNVKRSTTSGSGYSTVTSVTGTSYTDTGLANGTTYYYVVSAVNSVGESANSTQASATPQASAPATPTGLAATPGNAQVALTWGASSGATSYNVKRSTTSGSGYSTVTSVTGTSYTDTGLANGTTYYYVVSAVNAGGESANSSQVSATPQASAPAAPTGLTVTAGNAQATLNWTASSGATSYNVKRSTTSGSGYVTVTNVTGTSVVNVGLVNGTTYYYVVSALNAGGESANSSQVSVTPQVSAPAAPTGLTATAGNAQAALSWTASSGATSYNVKRSTTSGSGYVTVTNVTGTSVVNPGLANGTTYYYVVSALNAGGESANSSQVSVTPQASAPAAPTGLTATAGNAQVALSWTASSGATSYNVKRSTTSGGPYTTVANISTTAYTDTGLVNGTTYYYVVSALNAGGESANSSQVSATPQVSAPAAPTGLAATPGNAQVALSWTASSGATSYNVKRSTTNGGPYTTVASGVTATSYTNTGLTNGTTYYYVVSAVNAGGESANSSQVSATPSSLPSPWSTGDIGAVGLAGSASYSSGVYTVAGSGSDTWGTADQFRYVYQTGGTNCSITAKVLTVSNSNGSAKGGVMIRETLATNAVDCLMDIMASNGGENIWRTTTGGSCSSAVVSGITPPYWVRVTRSGSRFIGYRSTDGTTWTPVATNTITMANSVNIGLFVCSHNNSALCTATFTNVVASP